MMHLFPSWFVLTPLGLTSLALLLLTGAFFTFLAQRRPYSPAGRWLLGHEASLIFFLSAHLLVISAFLPFWYPVTYLSFVAGMACLLQFAFAFPAPLPNRTVTRWVRVFSGISVAVEFSFAIAFWIAPQIQNALALRTVGVVLGLWQSLAALFVLGYQAARLDESNRAAWLSLIAPRKAESRAARNMLLATLAIFGLAAITFVYRMWLQHTLSESFFNIAWSISLMLMLALFDLTYLINTPDRISFQVKLILGTLTAVLTSIWLLSLIYPFQLQIEYDLMRKTDVRAVQSALTQTGAVDDAAISSKIEFIVACAPASPNQPDLLFVRDADSTLDFSPLCGDHFFVGSIYGQGSLNSLHIFQKFIYDGRVFFVGFAYADYLNVMNQFSLPIALVMLGSALVITMLLPPVFYSNLGKPFNVLLEGMQQVNHGRLDVAVPIQSNDEIGMLAQSFNAMAVKLRDSVAGLENQIAESLKAEKSLREQQEQLRALSARLAEVEEAERRKLGRELHDQAGQNLTALSLTLKLVRTQLAAGAQNPAMLNQLAGKLDDASDIVHETADRIRNVMEDLHPPALEEFGLVAALRWYTAQFTSRTGINVDVSSPEPALRHTPQVEMALFRIAQEALTNVARHAHASWVEIQVNLTAESARMVIFDNGIGFAANIAEKERAHWGLHIMAERAESVGGIFRVESFPNGGTRVIVEV